MTRAPVTPLENRLGFSYFFTPARAKMRCVVEVYDRMGGMDYFTDVVRTFNVTRRQICRFLEDNALFAGYITSLAIKRLEVDSL